MTYAHVDLVLLEGIHSGQVVEEEVGWFGSAGSGSSAIVSLHQDNAVVLQYFTAASSGNGSGLLGQVKGVGSMVARV